MKSEQFRRASELMAEISWTRSVIDRAETLVKNNHASGEDVSFWLSGNGKLIPNVSREGAPKGCRQLATDVTLEFMRTIVVPRYRGELQRLLEEFEAL